MAEKLTNITAPQYRCPTGECPAVYKSGENFVIIGTRVVSQIADKAGPGEEAVEISADLLLSSLGLPALIEAAKQVVEAFDKPFQMRGPTLAAALEDSGIIDSLRDAINRMGGE